MTSTLSTSALTQLLIVEIRSCTSFYRWVTVSGGHTLQLIGDCSVMLILLVNCQSYVSIVPIDQLPILRKHPPWVIFYQGVSHVSSFCKWWPRCHRHLKPNSNNIPILFPSISLIYWQNSICIKLLLSTHIRSTEGVFLVFWVESLTSKVKPTKQLGIARYFSHNESFH